MVPALSEASIWRVHIGKKVAALLFGLPFCIICSAPRGCVYPVFAFDVPAICRWLCCTPFVIAGGGGGGGTCTSLLGPCAYPLLTTSAWVESMILRKAWNVRQ